MLKVRSEEGRVVGGKGAEDAGRQEVGERMLLERAHGAEAEVRDGADVEDDSPVGKLAHQSGVVDGTDAVTDSVCLQPLERIPDRIDAGELSRVRDGGKPALLRKTKDPLERSRRALDLRPSQTNADDATIAVGGRVSNHEFGRVEIVGAGDVGRELHLDPVELARFLRAVAVALEYLFPGAAAPHSAGEKMASMYTAP